MIKKYIGDLFLTNRWYMLGGGTVVAFIIAFFAPFLYEAALLLALLAFLLTLTDYTLLFLLRNGGLKGSRSMARRFSLGDDNHVHISLTNNYPFRTSVDIIDELPVQFQERNFLKQIVISYTSSAGFEYALRPVSRGEYAFGNVLCYVKSPLGLLSRRIAITQEDTVKVYPSYQQLKKYQLMATSDQLTTGIKKIRRLGHSLEFEKIKEYVTGDDVRTINWKATARKGTPMVNTYTDARQQLIYCVMDKGRAMKMPFEGMTLLDYSINASLALLNVAMLKQDRAGLLTFSNKVNDFVPADRRGGHLNILLETLYKQHTEFKESSYEQAWSTIHKRITQRSLLLFFTNFETMASLERQLPYLKRMASRHLVCLVFFQNTLLKELHETHPDTVEGIYIKTIADRFDYEKKQIVKELKQRGIPSILTTPQSLSIDVINKYLEFKARRMV